MLHSSPHSQDLTSKTKPSSRTYVSTDSLSARVPLRHLIREPALAPCSSTLSSRRFSHQDSHIRSKQPSARSSSSVHPARQSRTRPKRRHDPHSHHPRRPRHPDLARPLHQNRNHAARPTRCHRLGNILLLQPQRTAADVRLRSQLPARFNKRGVQDRMGRFPFEFHDREWPVESRVC